jgi:superfamily II DNA or RNA helicase
MSVIVDRFSLTDDQKKQIHKELTIILEKGRGKYERAQIVQLYHTTPETVAIPLYYALNVLDKDNDDVEHPRPNIDFTKELRDYQKPIVNKCITKFTEYRSATLIASTGAGKTVIGTYFGHKLRCVTCILIDSLPLIESWSKTISTFTKSKCWIVDNDPPEEIPDYIICMEKRIPKIPDNIAKAVGLVIVDEAHCFCTAKRVNQLLYFNPKYIISMTATPNRTDGGFEIINKLSGADYVEYSSNKKIQVYRINTPLTFNREYGNDGEVLWHPINKELHFSPVRNKMLLNLIMANKHRKILIFTGLVEHGEMLCKAFTSMGIEHDYMFGGKKKRYRDSNVLIGTPGKIGKGFDEKMFCEDFNGRLIDMVVVYNSYKSLIQLEQNIGRSRSDFPEIYHFVDADGIIYRHWLELRKFYRDPKSKIKADISLYKVGDEYEWPFDLNKWWSIKGEAGPDGENADDDRDKVSKKDHGDESEVEDEIRIDGDPEECDVASSASDMDGERKKKKFKVVIKRKKTIDEEITDV